MKLSAKIKKRILLSFFLIAAAAVSLFCVRSKPHYEHEFAICAMFKNEALYLKEWIDYHHNILGATYFYLYNNGSTDHYREVLAPYIEKEIIELIEWETCEAHAMPGWSSCAPWDEYQIGAYNDCLKNRALGKVHWIAIHDIDEFIVPVHGPQSFRKVLKMHSEPSLRSVLTKLKRPFRRKKTIGSLALNWLVFGTSHVWDVAPTELLTEKLYMRAKDTHPWNRHLKCIHRPEAVETCLIHEAILKENYRKKHLHVPDFRIHHYWSGPEKKLIEKRKWSPEELSSFSKEFNCIEDKTIFQHLKKMKVDLFENPLNTSYDSRIEKFTVLGNSPSEIHFLHLLLKENFPSLKEAGPSDNKDHCLLITLEKSPYQGTFPSQSIANQKLENALSLQDEKVLDSPLEWTDQTDENPWLKDDYRNRLFVNYDLLLKYPEEFTQYLIKKYKLKFSAKEGGSNRKNFRF